MRKTLIQAELKALHSPDVANLAGFQPDADSGFLVQIMVGPFGSAGEESFDIMVCTPEWFAADMKRNIVSGRHYLFMKRYSYQELSNFLKDYCASCEGDSWAEVALKLSRLGHWEFDLDLHSVPGHWMLALSSQVTYRPAQAT